MMTTVATHKPSDIPSPDHRVERSAPSALPSAVKIAFHGSRLHRPDKGCRRVKISMDSGGMPRNSDVTVRMTVLMMRC